MLINWNTQKAVSKPVVFGTLTLARLFWDTFLGLKNSNGAKKNSGQKKFARTVLHYCPLLSSCVSKIYIHS
jgi:hypothetical protein